MILCIRNNCLDLYLNYFDYLKQIPENELTGLIKTSAIKVNEIISNILYKVLLYDVKHEFNLVHLGEILRIKINPIFEGQNEDNIKQANVILYQFSIYQNINENFLKAKLKQLVGVACEPYIWNYILSTSIRTYINTLVNYKDLKNFLFELIAFLNEIGIDVTKLPELQAFEDILVNNLQIYTKELYLNSLMFIRKYLFSIKGLKQLLAVENELVKYDILVIISNNINEILLNIYGLNIKKIRYKKILLKELDNHVGDIFSILRVFFEDNYYMLENYDIESFKAGLCNSLLIIYTEMFRYMGITKLWQEKQEFYVLSFNS
jgi:hypothetical protein